MEGGRAADRTVDRMSRFHQGHPMQCRITPKLSWLNLAETGIPGVGADAEGINASPAASLMDCSSTTFATATLGRISEILAADSLARLFGVVGRNPVVLSDETNIVMELFVPITARNHVGVSACGPSGFQFLHSVVPAFPWATWSRGPSLNRLLLRQQSFARAWPSDSPDDPICTRRVSMRLRLRWPGGSRGVSGRCQASHLNDPRG